MKPLRDERGKLNVDSVHDVTSSKWPFSAKICHADLGVECMALIRYCTSEALRRLKRCGRSCRIFWAYLELQRCSTELTPCILRPDLRDMPVAGNPKWHREPNHEPRTKITRTDKFSRVSDILLPTPILHLLHTIIGWPTPTFGWWELTYTQVSMLRSSRFKILTLGILGAIIFVWRFCMGNTFSPHTKIKPYKNNKILNPRQILGGS